MTDTDTDTADETHVVAAEVVAVLADSRSAHRSWQRTLSAGTDSMSLLVLLCLHYTPVRETVTHPCGMGTVKRRGQKVDMVGRVGV